MPKLQRMDYEHGVTEGDGGRRLRVTADPALAGSRAAAAAAEALVARTLPGDRWARRHARLVIQAVEWRTLAERNRDVFLAENLRWLAEEAFPGTGVVALAHVSHAARHPGRMGAFLDGDLGRAYRAVALEATSGSYRYFGEVSEIDQGAALVLHEVEPADNRPTDCLRPAEEGRPVDAVIRVSKVAPI